MSDRPDTGRRTAQKMGERSFTSAFHPVSISAEWVTWGVCFIGRDDLSVQFAPIHKCQKWPSEACAI